MEVLRKFFISISILKPVILTIVIHLWDKVKVDSTLLELEVPLFSFSISNSTLFHMVEFTILGIILANAEKPVWILCFNGCTVGAIVDILKGGFGIAFIAKFLKMIFSRWSRIVLA
jgi:hypothetical protein